MSPSKATLIADSGASGHYIAIKHQPKNSWRTESPISVRLPNGEQLKNTHECLLDMPQLPKSARLARIFPGMKHSLLSLGQLCDGGCKVELDSEEVKINLHEVNIMTGYRNHHNKLWEIDLDDTSNRKMKTSQIIPSAKNTLPSMNNVFKISSLESTVKYLHAACFYPAKSTWIKAIKAGFFTTWPKLTVEAVQKFLAPSTITSKGRMKQTEKNVRSTKRLANRMAVSNIETDLDPATISCTTDADQQIFVEDLLPNSPLPEKNK